MARGGMTLAQLKERDAKERDAKRQSKIDAGIPLPPPRPKKEPVVTIPAACIVPGSIIPAAVAAAARAELERRGVLPKPKPAWDASMIPPSALAINGLRGAGYELWHSRDFETILAGPAESSKTWNCCRYANALLWKYPGAQGVLLRKTYSSAITTCVQTYKRIIGENSGIKAYGGEKPEWYDYPNGSRLWIAGLNNLTKVLSGERDFFFLNQAEEFSLEEWETLTSRATGRGATMPYTRVFGDCNPGPPSHWILSRENLKLLQARHEDNPTLFDDAGVITEQGKRSLAVLDALTGIRYLRLRLGRWVQAEGVVYEGFDRSIHCIPRFKIPAEWRRFRVIDFGYTNPFVCQWWAVDGDGRMYLYREIYLTQVLVSEIARHIRRLSAGEDIEATICDHDAEDRATLASEGIRSIPAYKKVSPGIQAVADRLKPAGDGRPRLFILNDSLAELTFPLELPDPELVAKKKPICTAQEFEYYVWPKGADGKPMKEEPVKEFDHGCDCVRYISAHLGNIGKRRGRAY